jgi:membrane protein insertase Oxa1/YidC/SpoIIIJ
MLLCEYLYVAGCLPSIATIPIFIGLYRSLTNVATEGLLDTEVRTAVVRWCIQTAISADSILPCVQHHRQRRIPVVIVLFRSWTAVPGCTTCKQQRQHL